MPGRSRYHAPPVSCLVGRCVLAVVLLGVLGLTSAGALLGGAVWGATLVDHPEAVRSLVLGGAAWCLVLGWAVWQWWHSPQGRLVWREGQAPGLRAAVTLFIVQLCANALWSWLFFAWHQGALAFADVLVLLALIVATTAAFWRIHRLAAALMLPYIAWVCVASALTWSVWQSNPGVL